jgi:uncharacterized protein with PIN domain
MGETERGNDKKYIVDSSLPGIAKHLRILGVDTIYDKDYPRNYVLFIARRDDRVIVTQSVKLQDQVQLMSYNRERRKKKIEEYEQRYQETLLKQKDSTFVFSHEKSRISHLTADQIAERIEMMKQEQVEEAEEWYEYKVCFLESHGRYEQLRELVNRLKIVYLEDRVFDRCTKCNGELIRLKDKSEIKDKVQESTYKLNGKFKTISNL